MAGGLSGTSIQCKFSGRLPRGPQYMSAIKWKVQYIPSRRYRYSAALSASTASSVESHQSIDDLKIAESLTQRSTKPCIPIFLLVYPVRASQLPAVSLKVQSNVSLYSTYQLDLAVLSLLCLAWLCLTELFHLLLVYLQS